MAEAYRNRTYLGLISQSHKTVLKTAPFTRTEAPPGRWLLIFHKLSSNQTSAFNIARCRALFL